MHALLGHKFVWSFLALLAFCSLMVFRQLEARQSKHAELREAFILLHAKGYTNQAQRLFERLSRDLSARPDESLQDDYQRTVMLVNGDRPQPGNLLWRYHWQVSGERERRTQSILAHALRLAEKEE